MKARSSGWTKTKRLRLARKSGFYVSHPMSGIAGIEAMMQTYSSLM